MKRTALLRHLRRHGCYLKRELVVEATDNGTPALTRYQRVVGTVTR